LSTIGGCEFRRVLTRRYRLPHELDKAPVSFEDIEQQVTLGTAALDSRKPVPSRIEFRVSGALAAKTNRAKL
jgi:hypothetical protein